MNTTESLNPATSRVQRLRAFGRQHGQVMVMFAIMLPAFFAIMGLAIDSANIYRARRDMQSAADLAALSGSIDLPHNTAAAKIAAVNNAGANGFLTGVSTTSPYDGSVDKIEVQITGSVDTFFMGILGYESVDISARAVAIHDTGNVALFAGKNVCDVNNIEAIDWSGSDNVVVGGAHSNSGIKVSGSNNTLDGPATYFCDEVVSGSGNSFESGPTQAGQRPWPITYSLSDFPCTYGSLTSSSWDTFDINTNGPWWVGGNSSSDRLNPGVYCAKSKLVLSDSDVEGNVTFVANDFVHVSGSNFALTPYKNEVLLFSNGTGDDAIYVSGSGGSWEGTLYAPRGKVQLSGSNNMVIDGSVVSWTIKLNGSDLSITGNQEQNRAAQLLE